MPQIDANASAERQQFSPSEFGGVGPPFIFNLFQSTVNVSYAPDVFGGQRRLIETQAALADYQRFQLEATYLTLTSNVVTAAVQEASLRGQIDATLDIIKSQTDQLDVVRNQFDAGAAAQDRRAHPAIGSGDDAGDLAAAAEAARAAAPCAVGADRPLPERCAQRSSHAGVAAAADRSAAEPAVAARRAAPRRARRAGAVASGQRPDRRRHCQQAAAVHAHRQLRQRRRHHRGSVHAERDDLERGGERHAADFPRLHAVAPTARRGSGL